MDGDEAFLILQGNIAGMQPAVADGLSRGFGHKETLEAPFPATT
jgi:hypothetical protein